MTYAETLAYVGVKRRTFDAAWRPRLRAIHQGTCLIFDRQEIDALFEAIKAPHAEQPTPTLSVAQALPRAQNTRRNERPGTMKGVSEWAEKYPGSTPEVMERGRSTSGGATPGFASVASQVLRKQSGG
ncbi:hypothetical protein HQN59_09365 [Schlegelella sp. ID0723]|uniref:Uncharacterized protein n=1 Tax=Piscinibacter koreensis TaxID=2742824 RepID=A0A7Y6TWF9_9BURK|nr:hypothetical protein [Schlegelella koreensis]